MVKQSLGWFVTGRRRMLQIPFLSQTSAGTSRRFRFVRFSIASFIICTISLSDMVGWRFDLPAQTGRERLIDWGNLLESGDHFASRFVHLAKRSLLDVRLHCVRSLTMM
jgi:hypothetical protein